MRIRSVHARLLVLVAGVALGVGGLSATLQLVDSLRVLRAQVLKRGRCVASNLADSSKYGVLKKDKPLLTQLLERALASGNASDNAPSDVVGAVIRDAQVGVLVQKGAAMSDLPPTPAARSAESDAVTDAGEGVLLFRAPVTSATGGSERAAEFGFAAH